MNTYSRHMQGSLSYLTGPDEDPIFAHRRRDPRDAIISYCILRRDVR